MEVFPQKITTIIRKTPEGRLLLAFFGLLAAVLVLVFYFIMICSSNWKTMLEALVLNSIGSRGPAVGLCLLAGWPPYLVYLYNVVLELLNLLLIYSLFVLSIHHYLNFKWLEQLRSKAEATAHRYEKHIKKYGFIGVLIFVAIPLPMTGPVMGSIIAFFLGFSTTRVLFAVIPGFMISVGLWTFFFQQMTRNVFLLKILLVGLTLLSLFAAFRLILSAIKSKKAT